MSAKNSTLRIFVAALFLTFTAAPALSEEQPRNFLFLGGDRPSEHADQIARPDIEGVQIIYSWKALEPQKDEYDFAAIEQDLGEMERMGKKLFIQVQDRFFSPTARRVPDYILTDPEYAGGLARQYDNAGEYKPVGSGWTAKQWNPHVRARFQALLRALAAKYDGRIYGINLPESAFDPASEDGAETDFTCEAYFEGTLENMKALRAAFTKTQVVQYLNFWPCEWKNDRKFMERSFALAISHGIGLGGPDIIPYRRAHMNNSYPFFHQHKQDIMLVAMAVQEPTLTYTNPKTGEPFTQEDFASFARDYLGADIIFWSTKASWLEE